MVRTVFGVIMMMIGCLSLFIFISNGLLFPHLLGPITLVIIGIVLLIFKRKRIYTNKL